MEAIEYRHVVLGQFKSLLLMLAECYPIFRGKRKGFDGNAIFLCALAVYVEGMW